MQIKSIEDRFWAKVDKSGECWIWTGGRAGRGYGVFSLGGRRNQTYAHRYSYELAFGVAPGALFVCHTCDMPPCIRPAHLFLGTGTDNMQDAKAKGRIATGDAVANPGESAGTAKLTAADVTEIKRLGRLIPFRRTRNADGTFEAKVLTQELIAERFGVSDSMIGNILRGESWKVRSKHERVAP